MTTGARAFVLFALAALALPSVTQASGITLGRFGGLYGHPNAEGGLALYWNPSLISLEPGFFIALDGSLVWRVATFDRRVDNPEASPEELAVNAGEARLFNVAMLPYGALGYTFDLGDLLLGVGFGVVPAYGGRTEWPKNHQAPAEFPGAVDGPQRWSSIESRLVALHYTGAVGATLPDLGLSLGFTVAYVTGELSTVRARNLNRTDALVDAEGNLQEGRVHFQGRDETVAFTVGASYALDNVRASFTYRSAYELRLVGPARQAYATNEPTVVDAFLELPLPHVFQTAITVELGRLALTGITDFTAWSSMRENNVLSDRSRERLLLIPRDLQNTLSLRAVIGWRFSDAFELSGMLGMDPSAVPEETVDASLYDAFKLQVGLGLRYQVANWRLMASYVHDILFDVEAENSRHEPPQNGRYSDTRGFLNLSVEGRF